MISDLPPRCWAEISLGRIRANFEAVRRLAGGVSVIPVVKANACGHGAIPVSRALCDQGATWLAVTSAEEGVALRDVGIRARILVMGGYLPVELAALIEYELTPVIHSHEGISEWDHANRVRGRTGSYHFKLDTGLWRLGSRAPAQSIAEAALTARNSVMEGLMTHFASAGDYEGTQTEEQANLFFHAAAELERAGIRVRFRHLCGTVAVAYGRRQVWQDMVRVAHAIYGYIAPASGSGAPPRILDVSPALEWKAVIIGIKDVPAGAGIGYRATFRAEAPMRIAIVAAGYADGIPHQLANRGIVIAGGRRTRILGAIAMDLTAVDICHAPGLKVGDVVTLLGREGEISIDAQELGGLSGTSSYSILCGITARVRRYYRE